MLLEDVHSLRGKERTQVELAFTLDTLFEAGKKIIFSSCYLPGDIPKLDDKLRLRLSGAIISNINKISERMSGKKMTNFYIPSNLN
jgi:chromosomal replication initiator protein